MGYYTTAHPISPSQVLVESGLPEGGIALKPLSANHLKALFNSLRNGAEISGQEAQSQILLPH